MRALAPLALMCLLAGCSGPLRLLTGAGPKVAANVQAGQSNHQTIGSSQAVAQKLIRPQARTIEQSAGETAVRAERIERLEVRQDVPFWVWVLCLALWQLPAPAQMGRFLSSRFLALFKKNPANRS